MIDLERNAASEESRDGSGNDPYSNASRARDGDEGSTRDKRDWMVIDCEIRAPRGVPGLTPERVEQIRRRMAEDAYRSDAVLDLIARRMIAEGDI